MWIAVEVNDNNRHRSDGDDGDGSDDDDHDASTTTTTTTDERSAVRNYPPRLPSRCKLQETDQRWNSILGDTEQAVESPTGQVDHGELSDHNQDPDQENEAEQDSKHRWSGTKTVRAASIGTDEQQGGADHPS